MTTVNGLPGLLPAIQALSRAEKFEVLRVLQEELRTAERTHADGGDPTEPFPDGAELPVWTPLDAYDASFALQAMLDEEGRRP